ncbi:Crp/Fnr family transcriptional regulator [Sulfuricella denitrificans skB26]|uniref:Crp/Fnr family transcriptional regulator n=1 Tax=Sulfuricella denitrificans (strain DSM 22764 / NBRC 105220 / skB26) TaxID=1163617 RepID=S6ABC7_SULDS|nr:hypothetical protein [Sulfuricella denitrificans]BAN34568.1 Crp/Fnr family transcriptional regulator [Sulfuricella denitrificans skB26]
MLYFGNQSQIVVIMEDGASAEFAGVGNEGVIGVALSTGGETMLNLAMVRCAGYPVG